MDVNLHMNSNSSIPKVIDAQNGSFRYFLETHVLNEKSWEAIKKIVQETEVYVFSGVIRDFLTGDYSGVRDLDFVLVDDNYFKRLATLLAKKNIVKMHFNQFGGIKMEIGAYHIDIWRIQDTWGIRDKGLKATVDSLIDSAFFNFQAIVYSLRENRFIYHVDFCQFLNTRVMDVVYDRNPNIPLCIVNVCHYWALYRYYISHRLACWLKEHYMENMELYSVQLRHFGQILYTKEFISKFMNSLFLQL